MLIRSSPWRATYKYTWNQGRSHKKIQKTELNHYSIRAPSILYCVYFKFQGKTPRLGSVGMARARPAHRCLLPARNKINYSQQFSLRSLTEGGKQIRRSELKFWWRRWLPTVSAPLLIAVLILLQPLVEYSVRMVPNHTGHSDAESQMQASQGDSSLSPIN